MSEKDSDIFANEAQSLKRAKDFIQKGDYEMEDLQLQYKSLIENYEELFSQLRIITKISDRIQRKLDKTNLKLEDTNDELNVKNVELQETIDALTKARIGRKAATMVLGLAIALFLISEGLLEPIIEDWAEEYYQNPAMAFWVGLFLKALIALSLKPIEMITEGYLSRKAQREAMKAAEAASTAADS